MSRVRSRRAVALVAAVGLAASTLLPTGVSAAPASPAGRPGDDTFHNAVSDSFSDTFADPAVIQGKDGWWYTYATADPLSAGDAPGIMHIARTKNWSDWEYLGNVFNETNRPSWAEPSAGLWAPDVRYINGQYLMYYTVTDTTLNPQGDSAIGAATAPNPAGPWTPVEQPVVFPRKNVNDYFWTFDPAGFTDVDGQRYLYWGSYYGGLWVTKVAADGLTAVGSPTMVAIDNRYEGSYVVRHDGWYYLMGSSANCCAGPTTGYAVYSGRSRSPLGPFVDSEGTSLTTSRVGGTPLLHQNGNRFIGTGHHAVATDNEGRDFIVYHALDYTVPWLTEPFGINRRPMLIDRIDWIDGWPTVRAGAGPSDTDQPAPVLGSLAGIDTDDPASRGFSGLARGPLDAQSGATGLVRGEARTSDVTSGDLRLRFDVKTSEPLTVQVGRGADITVTVDPKTGTLSATSRHHGADRTSTTELPSRPGWQTVVIEAVDKNWTVTVLESDLGDPHAELSLTGSRPNTGPVVFAGSSALIDNVSVRRPAQEATRTVAVPVPGKTLWQNDFSAGTAGLQWVRQNSAAVVSGGQLAWPVENADLVGTNNTGGLLLTDAPTDRDWIAETKVTLDLGTDSIRNYQQAGMIVHATDDDFARLGKVAIWNTRQTEWGRERAGAADGRLSWGGGMVGTEAATQWMRIAHTRNPAGDHLYRAATSRDGINWTWGGVWTFGPDTKPKIGLYAQGGSSPAAVASFDYLRISSTQWPTDSGRG